MSSADDGAHSDYEREILRNIEKHGWFCTAVFDNKGKSPDFSYSVGFTQTLNSPEFIVFGLEIRLMHRMLWEVFRQVKSGKIPADDQIWSNVIEGYNCISRAVHSTNVVRDYLNSAMWFWGDPAERGGPLKAFQLIWPAAKSGLYPWDADCPQDVRDCQPPLYLPNRSLS